MHAPTSRAGLVLGDLAVGQGQPGPGGVGDAAAVTGGLVVRDRAVAHRQGAVVADTAAIASGVAIHDAQIAQRDRRLGGDLHHRTAAAVQDGVAVGIEAGPSANDRQREAGRNAEGAEAAEENSLANADDVAVERRVDGGLHADEAPLDAWTDAQLTDRLAADVSRWAGLAAAAAVIRVGLDVDAGRRTAATEAAIAARRVHRLGLAIAALAGATQTATVAGAGARAVGLA